MWRESRSARSVQCRFSLETAPALLIRRATVLVVEDDDAVRMVVRKILTQLGYHVVEACDGWQALAVSQSWPIHLVLSDVVLPKLSGPEVASRLRKAFGLTKVLFMSGYSQDWLARTGAFGPSEPFIAKPFSPEALAAKVREVLGA